MSDYNNILAQIGGALSAQATGGSQGLQAYMAQLAGQQARDTERSARSFEAQMARMAKRQSEAAAREFAREQQAREQAFQTARDDKRFAQEKELLEMKQGEDEKRLNLENNRVAGGIYNYAMSSPEARQAVTEQMYRTIPGLMVNGEPVPIDWENKGQTMQWLEAGAAGGFTVQAARDIGQEVSARAEWYQNTYGDRSRAPKGSGAEAIYAADRTKSVAALQKVEGFEARVTDLTKRAADLENRAASISPSQYHEDAVALGKELTQVADDLEAMRADSPFLARGAWLHSQAAQVAASISNLGDTIYKDQRSKGAAALSAWDPAESPEKFPGFMEGYGGGADEGNEFNWLLTREGFVGRQNPEWRSKADFFESLSQEDLQYLDPQQAALYKTLKEERGVYGENQVFDLAAMLRARRAAAMAEDSDRVAVLDSIISDVQRADPRIIGRKIQAGVGAKNAAEDVRRFGRSLDVNNLLGAPLFQSDEEVQAALAAHGKQNELGYFEMPSDSNAFLSDYVATDVGMSRIVTGLMENVMGEGAVPIDVAVEQMLERGNYALKKLGLDTGANRQNLRSVLQARTGHMATIEPAGGAPQQMHNYDYNVERFRPAFGRDHGDQVDPVDLQRWETRFDATVFNVGVDPSDATSAVYDTIRKFRMGRKAFTQDWAWFGSRWRGDEKRLRLAQEAASETSTTASFYDLFDVFREQVPVFAKLASEPGRVRDRSHVTGHYVHSGGSARYVPQYAEWATKRGDWTTIVGKDSFAQQYVKSTSDEERDENIVNMLGYMDFMRGFDLRSEVEGLAPEQRKVLLGIQTHLRGLDLNEAVAAISGPEATGFSFEDLGLAVVSPETAEADSSAADSRTLAQMAVDPDAELRAIGKARRDLELVGDGDYLVMDPGTDRVDYEIAKPIILDAENKRLDAAEARAQVIKEAREYPMLRDAGMQLADLLLTPGVSIESPGDIEKLVNEALPAITGVSKDALALEVGADEVLTTRIGNAPNSRVVVDRVLDILQYSDFKQLQSRAMSLSSTVPMANRNMVIQQKRLEIGQIAREIAVIRKGLQMRLHYQTGKFDTDFVPPALRPALENTNFAELAEKGDPESLGYMAMLMWAANRQVADY